MSDLKPIILKAFVGSYSDDFNNQIETGIPIDINIYGSNNSINVNDYVWVGWGASLQQGCNINKSCIVAAQAVVENEVPANSLIAGDPAKIIRSNITWHRHNMEYNINAVSAEYRTISNT